MPLDSWQWPYNVMLLRLDDVCNAAKLYPPNEAAVAAYRRWVDAGEDDGVMHDP